MKKLSTSIILLLCFFLLHTPLISQTLQGACEKAGFGIDGYIYANGTEYVGSDTIINNNNADDWFYDASIYDGTGINVLDTSGKALFRSLLMMGENIFFSQKMSVPPNSIVAGRRWQDASYVHDYFGGSGAIDSSSYITASKNGEPLEDWDTGIANVTRKNDLIDCYAHLRRDGTDSDNPLWLYLGFSRIASTGESYFDAEMFANTVEYDPLNGFQPVGTDEGHTAWQFDAAGNISKIGDMIVTVTLNTDNIPEFEIRIWVSRFDFENTNPATFNFGIDIDGASINSQYGYADILPPMGNEFGCGVTNQEPWPGPPWGTLDDHGNFSNYYFPGQFVEIGLNLYDFGIDPQLALELDACDLPFNNLIFKSRASSSFTAQLKDFAGPFYFVNLDTLASNAIGDVITCDNPVIPLQVENTWPDAYYEWSTIDGNILADSSSINDTIIYVDSPGTYILASAFMSVCELTYDTIVVDAIIDEPPANIGSEPVEDCSDVITELFALNDGYSYEWSGPDGATYSGQYITVGVPGIYYLEVTNEHGCAELDSIYVIDYPCQEVFPPEISTTVILDTLPPFFTPPPEITVECFDDVLDLGITGNVSNEFDICDPVITEAIFTDSFITDGYCLGTGELIRNWSLTDDCGNTFTATQQIILIDTTPPVFFAPQDVTILCDDDITDLNLTGPTPEVLADCDAPSITMSYIDIIENDYNCIGQTYINRIWTAIDDCGNIAVDTQFIMMMDTVAPQIVGVEEVPFAACDSIPAPPVVTAIDNCDPDPAIDFEETIIEAECPNTFLIVRTWTAYDDCGNFTSITQELNVQDNSDPVILAFPQDITISCDTIPAPYDPVVADNCDTEIDISYSEQTISGGCEGDHIIERTWIWTDDCGNELTYSQLITVVDTEAPMFTVPSDVTVECPEDINDLLVTGDVINEADNCTNIIGEAVYSDSLNFLCTGNGTIIRTWSLTDDCGNITEQTQVIQVIDTIPPVFTIPEDVTIQCDQDLTDLIVTGDVIDESDYCGNTIGQAIYTDHIEINPACQSEQNISRIWSLTDDCANITIDTQFIFIIDTVPPVMSIPEDITVDCHTDTGDTTLTGAPINITDNCDQNIGLPTFEDVFISIGYCEGSGQIQRTWTLSDECGNTISDMQLINLIDTIPPIFTVPADVSISCDDNPDDLNITGDVFNESDNCLTNIAEAVYSDSIVFNAPCEGSRIIYRTWTLEDACGNIASEVQVITVEDQTPPIIAAPEDVTFSCINDLTDSLAIGTPIIISDNCSSNFGNFYFIDSVFIADTCNYLIQRIWLGTDACGNIGLDTQMIVINDTIAPIAINPPSDTIVNCDNLPLILDLEFTDNCSGEIQVEFNENIVAGSCIDIQIVNRRWTATDECGNVNIIDQQITLNFCSPDLNIFLPSDTTLCENEPINFEIILSDEYVDPFFQWQFTEDTTSLWQDIPGAIDSIFTIDVVSQMNSGYYQVHVSDEVGNLYNDSCSVVSDVIFLDVLPHARPTNLVEYICEGESIFAGGAEQIEPGTYTDIYTSINGCDSIVFTNLILYQRYEYELEFTICANDSIFLSEAYQNKEGVYIDSLTSVNGCDSIIINQLFISDEEIEFYYDETICTGDSIWIADAWRFETGSFTETFTPQNGCDSIVITELFVEESNSILTEEASICVGEEVQLLLEGSDDIEGISWSPYFSLSCDDCLDPIAFPEVTTTYTVTYPSGCNEEMLESEVTVSVYDQLEVELLETEINIVQGDSVVLMVEEVDLSIMYTWLDINGNVICDSCYSIIVSPNKSTSYTVIASHSNYQCNGEASAIVLLEQPSCEHGTLKVANVIFPQSGGYGEFLEIKHERVGIKMLRIYNRWGELVFETNDLSIKWDGTFRGQLLNPGVYVYYIIGTCTDEKQTKFIHSGNVTLIH